jgi:hypothetical protein
VMERKTEKTREKHIASAVCTVAQRGRLEISDSQVTEVNFQFQLPQIPTPYEVLYPGSGKILTSADTERGCFLCDFLCFLCFFSLLSLLSLLVFSPSHCPAYLGKTGKMLEGRMTDCVSRPKIRRKHRNWQPMSLPSH